MHEPFQRIDDGRIVSRFDDVPAPPNQLRWDPLPMPDAPADFVDGLVTMAGNGSVAAMSGLAVHLYAANRSMTDRFFYDADGELLIVPQQGALRIAHRARPPRGRAAARSPSIPRGMRFRVELPDGAARGYVCENYGAHFRLAGPRRRSAATGSPIRATS